MIKVHLTEQSVPIEYTAVINTYTKAGMYCVYFDREGTKLVHKYPMCNIFRVEENY